MPIVHDIEKVLGRIQTAIQTASYSGLKLTDLPAYADAALNSDSIDDRQLLLERALQLMANLGKTGVPPEVQKMSMQLQEFVIDLLYKDLPHPPASYLSLPTPTVPNLDAARKYAFRTADGAHYNPLLPSIGMAGSPYARSVPSARPIPPSSLPDPGLVFDCLLARDKFVKHPGGISSLFFAFADLVIHSIFYTDPRNVTQNLTSSYLDLSILYGNSEGEMDRVRRKDGSGKLWEDVFADSRLLFMPPATCALLVLLSRNHNYIAQKILDIDEHKGYNHSLEFTFDEALVAQDDDIFHRARLVNCGFFMQIILGDYVGAILGLVKDQCDWRLDPLMEMRRTNHEIAPRGEGNVVSIEFNLLYRWHATVSAQDTAWTENVFKKAFPDHDLSTITPAEFHMAARKRMAPTGDVREWTFGGLSRGSDGRFEDSDLAKILHDATENRAGAFKARGIPQVLRVVEIMGMEQARKWGTCSLNEFRRFIGLKPYSSFSEWNTDKDVAATAEALYHDIDNLELHVGLQAEEPKKPGPGAGLCPGYTISRAILADAVCLTRGDRFMTVDFTPANLTAWGFQDCQVNKHDGSYGGMLTKLLFRTLPDYYPPGSAYAHFPFLDPVYMKAETMKTTPEVVRRYSWERPVPAKPVVVVDTYRDVLHVLSSPKDYATGYGPQLEVIIEGKIPDHSSVRRVLLHRVEQWTKYFERTTKVLVESRSFGPVGSSERYVDVVRDVINALPVRWVCEELAGISLSGGDDDMTEEELCKGFADVCQFTFLPVENVDHWRLKESSRKVFKYFVKNTKRNLEHLGSWFADKISPHAQAYDFLKDVLENSKRTDGFSSPLDLASSLFCEIVPTLAHFSQAIALALGYYLHKDRTEERKAIIDLYRKQTREADNKISQDYIRRALIAESPVSGVFRTATVDDPSIGVYVEDRVFASIAAANEGLSSLDKGILGIKEHGLLSTPFFEPIASCVLGSLLTLLEVHATLPTTLLKFNEDHLGALQHQYLALNSVSQPWPQSLLLKLKIHGAIN